MRRSVSLRGPGLLNAVATALALHVPLVADQQHLCRGAFAVIVDYLLHLRHVLTCDRTGVQEDLTLLLALMLTLQQHVLQNTLASIDERVCVATSDVPERPHCRGSVWENLMQHCPSGGSDLLLLSDDICLAVQKIDAYAFVLSPTPDLRALWQGCLEAGKDVDVAVRLAISLLPVIALD